jgi:hypothetical protein
LQKMKKDDRNDIDDVKIPVPMAPTVEKPKAV